MPDRQSDVQPSKILILADESANWKIAGLRQLDRLAFAINEFAQAAPTVIPSGVSRAYGITLNNEPPRESARADIKIEIFIFWKPTVPTAQRWLPDDPRLTQCPVHIEQQLEGVASMLSTHLILKRGGLADVISILPAAAPEKSWEKLSDAFANTCRNTQPTDIASSWRYVSVAGEIPAAERWFLRGSGKPQDGFIARFVNRPISRTISRLLLRTSLTPCAWTLSIFALPIAGFVLLLRGDYFGFISGAALFQLFSILDGCDGEIARAKYLDSERGARLDTLGDILGNILFALGLGFGLQRFNGFFYAAEGIFCAALIAANELLLLAAEHLSDALPSALTQTLYSRHRTMIHRAGLVSAGEKPIWWLFQLTKRDVAILFFFLLAIVGWPQWILHIWTVVSAGSLAIAFSAYWRARA